MPTPEAENKTIVRRFFEAFAADDQAALSELLSPDLVAFSHAPTPKNREAYRQEISQWHSAFGQTRFTVEEQIAEGDKVATRATLRAVHSRGEFVGLPPSGRQIEVGGIVIVRIQDGKILEHRVESDWWGMMQQIGFVPSPAATG